MSKIEPGLDWMAWLLVLVGAILVGIAYLQWKRGNLRGKSPSTSAMQPDEPAVADEPGEITPAIQTEAQPGTLTETAKQSGYCWLRKLLDFIKRSPSTQTGLEIIILLVGVYSFSQGFLDLKNTKELPGNESLMFQALDWVFYHSIAVDHQFPVWNPWMRTGQPFVADPMFHSLNPLVGVPTLLFGVQDGFKIGLFLSLLAAALGMWSLGKALGINRATRTAMGFMYAFSGQPLAHILQGQYLFVFGFAWIPWTILGLYQLQHTRRIRYIALSALAMALLILSGNSYYALFLAVAATLFVITVVMNLQRKRPFIQMDWKLVRLYAAVAVLALCLVAVHLLPLFEFSPLMNKGIGVFGSHSPLQIMADFTSKDTYRAEAYTDLPAREEFYAYIGWAPLILALFVPFAFRPGKRQFIIFSLLLLIFVVLWIDLKQMPWHSLYEQSSFLLKFRHLLRPLVFGSFAIWLMAGLAIDRSWQWLSVPRQPTAPLLGFKRTAAILGKCILTFAMVAIAWDLYTTHKSFTATVETCLPESEVMARLREMDPGEYYTQLAPNNTCLKPLLAAGARFIAPWYAWEDYRQLEGSLKTRSVQAKQRYTIQGVNEPAPESAILTEAQNEAYRAYYHPDSLPMAFSIPNAVLAAQNEEAIRVDEVNPQLPYFPGPNRVEVNAISQPDERLVLLVTYDRGWHLSIDGKPADVLKVSGYMAADMLPGTHQYQFNYQPLSFTIGLIISLLSLLIAFYLVLFDLRTEIAVGIQNVKTFWRGVRTINIPERLANWKKQRGQAERNGEGLRAISAVYHQAPEGEKTAEQAYFELSKPLAFADGQPLDLIVEAPVPGDSPMTGEIGISTAWKRWRWATGGMAQALYRSLSLSGVLFSAALVVYLITRLTGLTQFPISFLGDEAAQTLYAETLIANKFHDPVTGLYLPMYVEAAGNRWTPLLPMYIHAVTLTLFGKSVLVTRITSIAVGFLAAIAVGLILKQIFKIRLWWVSVLILAITPAWFLHSRMAFETVMTTAFFGMFLWFYLKYREQGGSVIPALLFGGLTFYTYSNGQIIAAGAAGLLFLSDLRYHWQRRKHLLRAVPVAVLVALPFILFWINKPEALRTHLRVVDSYWFHNIPFIDKLLTFLKNFTYGLSPAYWFFPNEVDIPRHRMLDIAHLPTSMLLFMFIGVVLCVWKFRTSRNRALILASLAVPLGASLAEIGITRVLAFVIPATLFISLGIDWLWEQIRKRIQRPVPEYAIAIPVFLVLTGMSIGLMRNSLVNGPLWFNDYGLYGMQYGAIQIFEDAIPEYWRENPDLHFRISSVWANGTERYLSYFLSKEDQQKVDLVSIDGLMNKRYTIEPNDIFVLTPSEYETAVESPRFTSVKVERIISYPDGSPGFYFIHIAYADDIDQIIAAEEAERKILKEELINLDGQPVTVRYSWLDMGKPAQIFDNDPFTLIRGLEANPFILELIFSEPRPIEEITLNLGALDADLTVDLYAQGVETPARYQESYRQVQEGDILRMKLAGGQGLVEKMHLEIYSPFAGEKANVHVRELQLLP